MILTPEIFRFAQRDPSGSAGSCDEVGDVLENGLQPPFNVQLVLIMADQFAFRIDPTGIDLQAENNLGYRQSFGRWMTILAVGQLAGQIKEAVGVPDESKRTEQVDTEQRQFAAVLVCKAVPRTSHSG